MKHQQPLTSIRTLLMVVLLVGTLGVVAQPGAAASPIAGSTLQNLPNSSLSPISAAQDWVDLLAGFALLAALSLGLGGWWLTRRVLKFK